MLEETAQVFDAPIPGQSLTGAPGAMAYEQPPQFTDPEDAYDYVVAKLDSDDDVLMQTISIIDAGIPLESIAKLIAFSGFTEGRWSPDVAELIQPAIRILLLSIADDAGIKPVLDSTPKKPYDGDVQIRQAMEEVDLENLPEDLPEEELPMEGAPPESMGEVPMESPPMDGGGFMNMVGGQ